MAFDPDSTGKRYFLVIRLDGTTLYLGQESFTLSDGTPIEALVTSLTPLARSAGSLEDPRLELPSMQLTLSNRPDQSGTRLQDLLDDYEWGNRPVELMVGQDEAVADYQLIWSGRVKFPADTAFNDDQVTVRLVDARAADGRYLPTVVFDLNTYPHLEAKAVNQAIPIVYGDWGSTVGSGCQLPAYQIDSTEGTGGRFKVAGHALKVLEAVYLNGAPISFTPDLGNGEFVLNVAYDPTADTVTVHGQGATTDGTPSGALLQAAPDLFRDLLVTRLGVDPTAVDEDALTAWAAELSADDHCRRWIGEEIHSDDLVAELLRDNFADLTVAAGQYVPRYRVIAPDSSAEPVLGDDILSQDDGARKVFDVERNPEAVYANEVLATYKYDPVNQRYLGRYLAEDSVAIAAKGVRVRRNLEMNWRYLAVGAQARAAREVFTFSGELELASLQLGAVAIPLEPTDQLQLVYSKYDLQDGSGVPFQIRQLETDPANWRCSVVAWNLWRLSTGTWTEDAAVTWPTATRAQQFEKGFWSDDNGYADPGSPPSGDSRRYRWW